VNAKAPKSEKKNIDNSNNSNIIDSYSERRALRSGPSKSTTKPIKSEISEALQTKNPFIEEIPFKDKIIKVQSKEVAESVLKVLKSNPTSTVWACDTEVADIDLKEVGPVGNGKVICISIYGGPNIKFGDKFPVGSTLWVENIGESEGLLQLFKDWFEDETYKKVWHNYGFDRHVMFNEGINCRGFAGTILTKLTHFITHFLCCHIKAIRCI
jgi:hypothetical protein